MTVLDLAVIAIVALSGLLAFVRGMVKEFFSLVGWIAGGLAVLFGLPLASPYVRQVIPIKIAADVVAGLAIFILVIVIVAILTTRISDKVKESSFGALDRSLGLLFGLFRGFILVSLAYILLVLTFGDTENEPDWMAEAQTKPALTIGGCTLLHIAPDDFAEYRELICDPESRRILPDQGTQDTDP